MILDPSSSHLDFSTAWHALTAVEPTHRASAQSDLAFWESHGRGYDTNTTKLGHFQNTLATIAHLIRPTDSLLDVGCGSGRYAVPLSKSVESITALDHSATMLDILHDKLCGACIVNVTLLEKAWEAAEVTPHDIVLAAWSLYRLPDLATGLQKLIDATRRTLIIITSPGKGAVKPQETPQHLYIYGTLWQLGYHADLSIINEYPDGADKPEPVAMIIWHREINR